MFAKSSNSEERSFKAIDDSFARYVSPLWVEILTVLGINRQCERPIGAEFFKAEGDCSSDFLGGYGDYHVRHRAASITEALIEEFKSRRPIVLQHRVPALVKTIFNRG
jgi:hypothetical protein